MVVGDVMFFGVFSQVFKSDVVFPKAKEREVVMLILGGPNVAISLVLGMFLKTYVFRRCALERPWRVLAGLLGWLWRSGVLLG